jgi:hypothetical protein
MWESKLARWRRLAEWRLVGGGGIKDLILSPKPRC